MEQSAFELILIGLEPAYEHVQEDQMQILNTLIAAHRRSEACFRAAADLSAAKTGERDDSAADFLGVFARLNKIRRIAAGTDDNQCIAGTHLVFQLETENLVKSDVIAQCSDDLNVVAHGMDAEAALTALNGILAEIADKVIRRAGAAAVSGDEDLTVILIDVQQDVNRFGKFIFPIT